MSIQDSCRIFDLIPESSFTIVVYHHNSYADENKPSLHSILSIDEAVLSNMTLSDVYMYIQNKLRFSSFRLKIFGFPLKRNSKKFKTIIHLIRNGNFGHDIWILFQEHRLLSFTIIPETIKESENMDNLDQQMISSNGIIPTQTKQSTVDPRISLLITQGQEFDERFESILVDYRDVSMDPGLYKNMLSILSEEITRLILAWDSLELGDFEDQEEVRGFRKENTGHLISICDKIDTIIHSLEK